MKTFGYLIGNEIYSRRSKNGWSQEYLAEKAGVDAARIGKWERGEVANPRGSVLAPVCELLGITQEDINALKLQAIEQQKTKSNEKERESPGDSITIQLPPQTSTRTFGKQLIDLSARSTALTALFTAALVGGLFAWIYSYRASPVPEEHNANFPVPSLAVLPFNSIGGGTDYLSRGISEGIIFALSRSPHLQVVPRSSSFAYKNGEVAVQEFGETIGVDYVLEGTVQRREDTVRVISQLIDVRTGYQRWTNRFDQEGADALLLQDKVSNQIMLSLDYREQGIIRKIESKRSWQKSSVELEEYDYMLRGHDYHLQWSKENVERALSIYEQGLDIFPESSLLRAKIGWALYGLATQGWIDNPNEMLKRATVLAEEAIADEKAPPISDYLAHRLLGWLYAVSSKDVEKGLEHMKSAVSLAPGIGRARADLGSIQLFAGKIVEGLGNLEKAEKTDPGYPRIALYKAWANRINGDCQAALAQARSYRIESIDKYLLITSCNVNLDKMDDAKTALATAISISPELSIHEYQKLIAFENQQFVEQFLNDLRIAGLVENSSI